MVHVNAWNRHFEPERVIAYALENPTFEREVDGATAAAMPSKGRWCRPAFKCTLDADLDRVIGFKFFLGVVIPSEEWPSYGLDEEREEH